MKALYMPPSQRSNHYLEGAFVEKLKLVLPPELDASNTVFVCIGTDRSTGDSLGPLVGSMLMQSGLMVAGTLEHPVHALNLDAALSELPEDVTVIGIDSCLGRLASVGKITCGVGPVRPGAGVGKTLTPVGDYHIAGVVNVSGYAEHFVLNSTRLHLVMGMAKQIVNAILEHFSPAASYAAAGEEPLYVYHPDDPF